jgi:hypothetical protein
MHSIMDPTVGTCAGSIVELTDVLTMDIHIPTEDIHIPTDDILLLPTEDIPPASEHFLVRACPHKIAIGDRDLITVRFGPLCGLKSETRCGSAVDSLGLEPAPMTWWRWLRTTG